MKRIPKEALVTYTLKPQPEAEAGLAQAVHAVEQAKPARGTKQKSELERAGVLLEALSQ